MNLSQCVHTANETKPDPSFKHRLHSMSSTTKIGIQKKMLSLKGFLKQNVKNYIIEDMNKCLAYPERQWLLKTGGSGGLQQLDCGGPV